MSRRSGVTYRIGTGALSLMMVLVILCLTALSVLSWTSADADRKLARRASEVTADVAEAQSSAQRTLSRIDGLLAECRQGAADDEAYLSAAASALTEAVDGLTVEGREAAFDVPVTEQLTLHAALTVLPLTDTARYALTSFAVTAAPTGFDTFD